MAAPAIAKILLVAVCLGLSRSTISVQAFVATGGARATKRTSRGDCPTPLRMAPNTGSSTLKPAAIPMMDSGKALARSGELLIDLTKALDLYGGALSAAGAQIRNSGDSLAQAAASCRFKTGKEIVIDELREAATCLSEASDKLELAAEEAVADQDPLLQELVSNLVQPTSFTSAKLEESGANILMQMTLVEVGQAMVEAAGGMEAMAGSIQVLAENSNQNADGLLSAQRMQYAAERLNQAGIELKGEVDKSKKNEGRAFLKGGGF